ncbi:hypothetical protein Tco_0900373, partial [Tanacetum coccineum]
ITGYHTVLQHSSKNFTFPGYVFKLLSSIMSAITDIRVFLLKEHLTLFVRSIISQGRLPLSTFLVDVVRHFRINISQISIIRAAKSGWMSFSKRSDNAPICYTKPLDSLKNWNNHFFWVDDFACPASFSWHTAKHVTRDPDPVAADFNAQDYATLVAHPSSFWKFPEALLCLVRLRHYYPLDEETYPRFLHKNGEEIDIFAFIHTRDPTKVKIVEREQNKDASLLLASTIMLKVIMLKVNTVVEVVAPMQPRRQRKRKSMVVDASGVSHPPKKLREDHGAPSGTSVGGKSRSAIKRLLARAVLNAKVRVTAIPMLPFVTTSVSSTLEREAEDWSSVSIMKTVTTITSTVDPALVAKDKSVKPSLFSIDSSSASRANPHIGVFLDLTGSDFHVGGIGTVIYPDTDLQKVYVPQWSVTNVSRLNDGRVCREMVDEFAPPKFFASVRGMEHDQLFIEFNVEAARQMCLSVEVRIHAKYNV